MNHEPIVSGFDHVITMQAKQGEGKQLSGSVSVWVLIGEPPPPTFHHDAHSRFSHAQ